MYRLEMGCQVIHDSVHERDGWTDEYVLLSAGAAVGLGFLLLGRFSETAATLAAGMGQYVGQVINATLFRRIRSTQMSFLQTLLGQGVLGSTDGTQPFSVICDTSNNPPERTSLGYVQSDAQVQYQAINERFVVNLEGGQTVQVTRQTLPTKQVVA